MEAMENKLWLEYREGSSSARQNLIEQYLPLARRLAKIIYARRYDNTIEFGDYLHLAYIGLLEAVDRYRHNSSAVFTTFAAYRIKGSILNGVPKMTERGDYRSFLKLAQRDRSTSLLGSSPQPSPNFTYMLDLIVGIALTYQLDELVAELDLEEDIENSPYASRSFDELQNNLKEVVAKLPDRDQKIIYYHYFYQMSFVEIAKLLGITKGRVSQLHKSALIAVRNLLNRRDVTAVY